MFSRCFTFSCNSIKTQYPRLIYNKRYLSNNIIQKKPTYKDLCLQAIENDYDTYKIIEKIDPKYLDADICLAAVKKNGNMLKHIPYKYHNKELRMAAVTENGLAIICISDEDRDADICLAAVKHEKPYTNGFTFIYPKNMK